MKTSRKLLKCFLSVSLLANIYACTDDDSNSTTDALQEQIENQMVAGIWYISSFIDSGSNETNHFTNYQFTFETNGVLNATNGSTSYTGSWSISDSNSSDDDNDSTDDLDFNIYFNLSNDFEDLNDDWDIVSQSATKIELIDISGGNGGTDYLTFQKN